MTHRPNRPALILAVVVLTATAGLGSAVLGLPLGSSHPAGHPYATGATSVARDGSSSEGRVRPGSSLGTAAGAAEGPEVPSPSATQWAVAKTLVIFNNSLVPGNFPVPFDSTAAGAASLAYDNRTGEIYVASFEDSISVISDSTNEVVALFEPLDTTQYLTSIVYDYKDNEIFTQYTGNPGTVAVTSAVTNTLVATITVGNVSEYNTNGLAYDSGLGEVFASNGLSSNVSVISTTSNKVVSSIALTDGVPDALAYDSGTHQVFVANDAYSANVSVISDATNTWVKYIEVGADPDALAYDPGKGEVFVANGDSSNVSVLNDTTDAVLTSVGVGNGPKAMAYDPADHEVWVTCANANVSVISDATNTVVATVPVESGVNGAAYDSGKGELWLLNGFPTYASAISATSNTVVANVLLTFDSRYWAYDSAHQEEFLADETSSEVAVVSDTTDHVVAMVPFPGAGAAPYRLAYDRGKGEVFTSDDAGGVGLSVINDTNYTVVKTIHLPGVEPTGLAYDPAKGEIFVGNAPGSNVTIINDTTNTIVGVVPNVGLDPWSLVYDPGKGEIFVANLGTGYSGTNVTVINDTSDTSVASINVGTDPLGDLLYDSGKGEIFVPNYGSRNVSVISDSTNTVVATVTTGTLALGAAYDPAADEVFVGNFNSETENVTVISDLTDTTVGSIYPDGFTPSSLAFDPVTGDLYTGDSVDGTVAVITPVSGSGSTHYTVTFTETGLPGGTSWSVTFNSTLSSSTTTSIAYSVLNGSYSFAVGTVPGYTPAPASGPVTVEGGPETVSIDFTSTPAATYRVTFSEVGLPSGTSWTVTLVSTPLSSTTDTIQFSEGNDTYTFTVGVVSGYSAAPSSGSVVVDGGPVSREITFTPASTPPPSSSSSGFLGLPGADGYLLLGALAALLVAFVIFLAGRRHKVPVAFTEFGLPDGTPWTVVLDETAKTSAEAVILFEVSSGPYSYRVDPVPGFGPSPGSGSVEVKRDRVDVGIRFAPSRPKG